jgi:hypothetical protein
MTTAASPASTSARSHSKASYRVRMCSIGPWLWGWGPWLERYVWFSTVQSARNWRRSRPIATARASIWSEHASCLPRRIGIRRSRWRIVSASADRRCSGGGSALPRAGSRVCCATRPASPARRRARGNHSAGGGADVHRAAALGDPPNRAGDGQIELNTWHHMLGDLYNKGGFARRRFRISGLD